MRSNRPTRLNVIDNKTNQKNFESISDDSSEEADAFDMFFEVNKIQPPVVDKVESIQFDHNGRKKITGNLDIKYDEERNPYMSGLREANDNIENTVEKIRDKVKRILKDTLHKSEYKIFYKSLGNKELEDEISRLEREIDLKDEQIDKLKNVENVELNPDKLKTLQSGSNNNNIQQPKKKGWELYNNGKYVDTFRSMNAIAGYLKIHHSCIPNIIKGTSRNYAQYSIVQV